MREVNHKEVRTSENMFFCIQKAVLSFIFWILLFIYISHHNFVITDIGIILLESAYFTFPLLVLIKFLLLESRGRKDNTFITIGPFLKTCLLAELIAGTWVTIRLFGLVNDPILNTILDKKISLVSIVFCLPYFMIAIQALHQLFLIEKAESRKRPSMAKKIDKKYSL